MYEQTCINLELFSLAKSKNLRKDLCLLTAKKRRALRSLRSFFNEFYTLARSLIFWAIEHIDKTLELSWRWHFNTRAFEICVWRVYDISSSVLVHPSLPHWHLAPGVYLLSDQGYLALDTRRVDFSCEHASCGYIFVGETVRANLRGYSHAHLELQTPWSSSSVPLNHHL